MRDVEWTLPPRHNRPRRFSWYNMRRVACALATWYASSIGAGIRRPSPPKTVMDELAAACFRVPRGTALVLTGHRLASLGVAADLTATYLLPLARKIRRRDGSPC